MKKINHIIIKILVRYAKKNLILMIMVKNTIKSEITVITRENIEVLLMINLRYKTPK